MHAPVTTSSMSKRVQRDIAELRAWASAQGLSVEDDPTETDAVCTLLVRIHGPADTPYVGGVFTLRCQLTPKYPFASPSVAFVTPVLHPNVEPDAGAICMDRLKSTWSACMTLTQVFELYIPALLACPEPGSALNIDAANALVANSDTYADMVRAHTREHASSSMRTPVTSG